MRPQEQHINHAYHNRAECCRKGCRRKATERIHFYSYKAANDRNMTYACADHGRWWITGLHGLPLGIQVAI